MTGFIFHKRYKIPVISCTLHFLWSKEPYLRESELRKEASLMLAGQQRHRPAASLTPGASVPWFFLDLWTNSPSLFGRNCYFFIWVYGREPLSTICNGCAEDDKLGLEENENYCQICSTFRTQKESAFESVVLIYQCSIEWQCPNPLSILRRGSSVTANLETISVKHSSTSVTELTLRWNVPRVLLPFPQLHLTASDIPSERNPFAHV